MVSAILGEHGSLTSLVYRKRRSGLGIGCWRGFRITDGMQNQIIPPRPKHDYLVGLTPASTMMVRKRRAFSLHRESAFAGLTTSSANLATFPTYLPGKWNLIRLSSHPALPGQAFWGRVRAPTRWQSLPCRYRPAGATSRRGLC